MKDLSYLMNDVPHASEVCQVFDHAAIRAKLKEPVKRPEPTLEEEVENLVGQFDANIKYALEHGRSIISLICRREPGEVFADFLLNLGYDYRFYNTWDDEFDTDGYDYTIFVRLDMGPVEKFDMDSWNTFVEYFRDYEGEEE